jgi:proline iminopeptidase
MNKDKYTNREFHLEVDGSHMLYVQDWGNIDAKVPILSLHGGPGGQSKDSHKGTYDPTKQRVIFFDQRGCGQSLPLGSLKNNTTADLVNDITTIADELGVKKFILTGRSWGSCLALAYAIKHPNRVHAMVLSGIFTGSYDEIQWMGQGRFQQFYPDAWRQYLDRTPSQHHDDPSKYHFEKALHGTKDEQKKSAFAYESLVAAVVRLDDRGYTTNFEEYDPSKIRIEIHYMKQNCFMPDKYILAHANSLNMPITVVQGRYDMVCPPKTAFILNESMPDSSLYTTLSGHVGEHEDLQLITQALAHLTNQ